MQKRGMWAVGIFMLVMLAAAAPLQAQDDMAKPPVFIYVSTWAVPRAQWSDMAKVSDQERALEDKLLADGTIVEYGGYENIVHNEAQPTHGSWYVASSEEGILKLLQAFRSRPESAAPVLAASKHRDLFLMSRTYKSRPGNFENAYLSTHSWDVKSGHFREFDEFLKAVIVPVLDKLLADGVLVGYSVDNQAVNTDDPNREEVAYIVADASGLDKVGKAFEAALSKDAEIGPAMSAMTKDESRRDMLAHVSHLKIK